MNELTPIAPETSAFRASTDAAGLCREIVTKTAKPIQGRKYVGVEGWQAIAIAHGCTASADHVERVTDEGMSGFKAIGIVRRMSDGAEISRGEGFLGDDEGMWAKRPVYARRAMVQTRAISRACRSAFAHVVVMIDANLSTTPAEEVPDEGFDNSPTVNLVANEAPPTEGSYCGPKGKKTELRQRANKLRLAIQGADDMDMLKAVWAKGKALVEQLEREWPEMLDGMNGDDIGILGEKEAAKARLSESEEFAALKKSLGEVETKAEMAHWTATYGEDADALCDLERARLDEFCTQKEAALEQLAVANT